MRMKVFIVNSFGKYDDSDNFIYKSFKAIENLIKRIGKEWYLKLCDIDNWYFPGMLYPLKK